MIFAKLALSRFTSIEAAHDESGQPVQRFRKDIIRVGKFVKESDDLEFEVTPKTLEHWVSTFHEMKKNGVKIPIPNTHEKDGDATQNHGWVEDMFVDGDMLVMTCDIIGNDSIAAAAKGDVSIKSPPEMTDGDGRKYIRPIVHVAMCTDPVITGLGAFIPIAASREKELRMDWKKLASMLGIEVELTGENAEEVILSKFKEFSDKVTELTASLEKAKEDAETEEDKDPVEPDPMLVKLASDNRKMKLDALVASSRITPDCRDKLSAVFVDTKPLTLALSNGTAEEFDRVVEALVTNDPVKLKEQSKAQTTVTLSDPLKKMDNNPLLADADARAKEAKAG